MSQNFFYPPSGGGSSSNASVGTNGATAPSSSTEVGFISGGNLVGVSAANPLPVSGGGNTADTTASGNLTALNSTVALVTAGSGTAIFQLSGTWVGTVTFEGSNDNFVTSQAIIAINLTSGGAYATTATANGFYSVLPQGFAKTQARMSAYTSGTAAVVANGSAGTRVIVPVQGVAGNLQATARLNDGSGNTITSTGSALDVNMKTGALPTGAASSANQTTLIANQTNGTQTSKITDGTNTAAVKAASTAPVATDPALVVTISPNSPSQSVSINDLYVTGQSAQTVLNNNVILAAAGAGATDALNYRSGSLQIVSTATGGAYIFEHSNDNVNYKTMTVYDASVLTGTPIVAAITPVSGNVVYNFPIVARYIRCRISTALTGGSVQAFTKLSPADFAPATLEIAQATAANLNATVTQGSAATTANSWPVKIYDTGSNNAAVIKGGGSAAGTSDTAIVVAVSPNNIIPVKPGNGTLTDNSGNTGATPSTSTTLMASNATRKYLFIQNLDVTNNIYINFTSAAANSTGSIKIVPGGSFVQEAGFVTTEQVNVLATVASVNFTAKQA